jgi:N6-L-threonylcarbamoyladenine synthase
VGLSFAKAFAFARGLPFIAVNHMLAHLYASRLETTGGSAAPASVVPDYPFLGLLVSGGHSIICRVDDFDDITVLGTTIDDAVGEAFDKVSKHYGFGYPGGAVIDQLARSGNPAAFRFPLPSLHKGQHPYDMSYSGLKTAVINQLEQFRAPPGAPERPPGAPEGQKAMEVPGGAPEAPQSPPGGSPGTPDAAQQQADIAASFQRTAVEILLRSLLRAARETGLKTIVAGGGVAANSYLRDRLAAEVDLACVFPPLDLCGDNGAMVAGIGGQYLARGETSPLTRTASARVGGFKRKYP